MARVQSVMRRERTAPSGAPPVTPDCLARVDGAAVVAEVNIPGDSRRAVSECLINEVDPYLGRHLVGGVVSREIMPGVGVTSFEAPRV